MTRVERVRLARKLSKRQCALSLGMQPPNSGACLRGEFFLTADQLFALWQTDGADPAFIMGGGEDGLIVPLHEQLRTLGLAASAPEE